jgi:hypothetical protein
LQCRAQNPQSLSGIRGRASDQCKSDEDRSENGAAGDACDIDGQTDKVEWSVWEKRHRRQNCEGSDERAGKGTSFKWAGAHESKRGQRTSFNGANGMSDIECKVTRVGASESGTRASFKIGRRIDSVQFAWLGRRKSQPQQPNHQLSAPIPTAARFHMRYSFFAEIF